MGMSFRENISGPIVRMAVVAALFSALLVLVSCGSADEPAATVAPAEPAATDAPTIAATSEDSSADTEPSAASAKLAPTFELPNAKGETIGLSSYAGDRNVVLVFYRGFW